MSHLEKLKADYHTSKLVDLEQQRREATQLFLDYFMSLPESERKQVSEQLAQAKKFLKN